MRKIKTPIPIYILISVYCFGIFFLAVSWNIIEETNFNSLIRIQIIKRLQTIIPQAITKPTTTSKIRIAIILGWTLLSFITCIAINRRFMLRYFRETWRTTRNETVIAMKDNWTNRRAVLFQYLFVFIVLATASIGWRAVTLACNSESPVVVVLSGSMEPDFYRGDILFLTNHWEDPLRVGEIMVFKIEGRDIPIVHRVMQVHEDPDGNIKMLTKGDNNRVNDRGLYAEDQAWLKRSDVVGRARFYAPNIGMLTIWLNETPYVKHIVVTLLLIAMLVNREV
jgi:signal peptidase